MLQVCLPLIYRNMGWNGQVAEPLRVAPSWIPFPFFCFKDYLFIHERQRLREREAETQAEEEAGSTQGARRGTRSRISRIAPWAESSAKPLSHLGCPLFPFEMRDKDVSGRCVWTAEQFLVCFVPFCQDWSFFSPLLILEGREVLSRWTLSSTRNSVS